MITKEDEEQAQEWDDLESIAYRSACHRKNLEWEKKMEEFGKWVNKKEYIPLGNGNWLDDLHLPNLTTKELVTEFLTKTT